MAIIGVAATTGSIGPASIPTVGYSTAFFVVQSPWGEDGKAVMCTSFNDFLRKFGGLNKLSSLGADGSASSWTTETTDTVVQGYYAVKAFFDEKGTAPAVAFVGRACKSSSGPTAAVRDNYSDGSAHNTTVTSKWKGSPGDAIEVKITTPSPAKGSGWSQFEVRHARANINEIWQIAVSTDADNASKDSELVTIALPAGGQLPSSTSGWTALGNDATGTADPFTATDADIVGTTASDNSKTGIQVFNDARYGSGLVMVPGKSSSTVASGLKTHAEAYNRLFLVGTPAGKNKSNIVAVISATSSNFGAFFAPRLWVADQNSDTGGKLLVDPVGHVAGLAARMDALYQGPHKAPAGVNHYLSTALDVERQSNGAELYDDTTSNTLADSFVNTIRIKRDKVVVWGMRTLATDNRWRQIPAARVLMLCLAQGILLAEPYTFEPIDSDGKLFSKVRSEFAQFLDELRRHGALFGDPPGARPSPNDAYAVVCDRSNNTPNTLAAGELHIDVAVAPTPNAETVKFNLNGTAPGFVVARVVQ